MERRGGGKQMGQGLRASGRKLRLDEACARLHRVLRGPSVIPAPLTTGWMWEGVDTKQEGEDGGGAREHKEWEGRTDDANLDG